MNTQIPASQAVNASPAHREVQQGDIEDTSYSNEEVLSSNASFSSLLDLYVHDDASQLGGGVATTNARSIAMLASHVACLSIQDSNEDLDGSAAVPMGATNPAPHVSGTQRVFSSRDLALCIADHLDLAELVIFHGINAECRNAVQATTALRHQLMMRPVSTPFLDLATQNHSARAEAIGSIKYSPYLKGLTTQAFLFDGHFSRDTVAGWPGHWGGVTFSFLPAALDAIRDYPHALKQMLYSDPPMQHVELVFPQVRGNEIQSSKLLLCNPDGVTLHDIIETWTSLTKPKIEKGAPICLTTRWADTDPDENHYTLSHKAVDEVYKKLGRCLKMLGALRSDAGVVHESFCGWNQDEVLLMNWYQKTCVDGQMWFGSGSDRQEQGQVLRQFEASTKTYISTSSHEISQGQLTKAQWSRICLERKRATMASTKVFNDPKLLPAILSYLAPIDLPNFRRINKATNALYSTDERIRAQLLLKHQNAVVLVPAKLSDKVKSFFRRKIVFNPLFSKLIATNLISGDTSRINEGKAGGHSLLHFQAKPSRATYRIGTLSDPCPTKDQACDTTAFRMHLTKPALTEVYIHLASLKRVEDGCTPDAETLVPHAAISSGYHRFIQSVQSFCITKPSGVTVGDVIELLIDRSYPGSARGLPVCITILDDPEAGANLLKTELRGLDDLFKILAAMHETEGYRFVFDRAMSKIEHAKYDDLKKRQFIYYGHLTESFGSWQGWWDW